VKNPGEQIKWPVGSIAPLDIAIPTVFDDRKVLGLTDTILLVPPHITFPFGAKKAFEKIFVPVKIFVKFPPRVVPDDTVARQDVLYIAELPVARRLAKNTFPFGRRTALEN
jgi:hypothetical protein